MSNPSKLDALVAGGELSGFDERLEVTSGPASDIPAVMGLSQEAIRLPIDLDHLIGEQVAISLWIYPNQDYRNGEGVATIACNLLDIPGIAALNFRQAPAACALRWSWDSDHIEGVDAMATNIPELPGQEWYHLLYTWDADAGRFDAYLNGTPQRLPGTEIPPWHIEGWTQLSISVGPFRYGAVTVEPRYMPPEEAEARDLRGYRGCRSDLLGRGDPGDPIDVDRRRGDLLYESTLGSEVETEDWVLEGPGIVTFEEGWMKMASERPEGPEGHIVHWCPQDFPESYVAEWEIQPVSEDGLCIVFFSAKGENGEDIFDPALAERNGVFRQYTMGDIVSYHVSYYANTPFNPGRTASHLRKNNHFYLVDNGLPGIPPGSSDPHQVRVVKDGSHIQFLVDDRVIIDFVDDGRRYGPVHGGGKIGLRQMQWMVARYRNLRVWQLKPIQHQ
ncbi:MAG: DUF1961 family protein [Anaerolineae bacterium]